MAETAYRPVIELDSRGRLPLARFGVAGRTQYIVEPTEDGGFMLTPAIVLTPRERAILADPEAVASIKRGIADAAAGRGSVRSFAEFLDAPDDPDDD